MQDVFISYAREDRATAKRLADAFVRARGWQVWWDTALNAGEPFPKRIQDVLAATRCVIVLWSRHSIDSDWVIAEATEGWERHVLVPVGIDGSIPPMPFRQTHAADLSQWNGSANDAALLELLESVQRVLAQGASVDRVEIEARQQRQRQFQRRQRLRYGSIAAVIAVVTLGSVLFWHFRSEQRERVAAADALAARSTALLQEVTALSPEEQHTKWWYLLVPNRERKTRLELSVLLGIEAYRVETTEQADRALRDAVALLPWSDALLQLDDADAPSALDFSADGRLLAGGGAVADTLIWQIGSDEKPVRIAHGGTGGADTWQDLRGRLAGTRGSPLVLDFSPVGEVLATAGPDTTARLWDARSGRELKRLDHPAIVNAVTFSPDGALIVTACEDGSVHLWNLQGKRLHSMRHDAAVYWLAFAPDGNALVSTSYDRSARVWDTRTGAQRLRLVHEGVPQAARFTPDGTQLLTFGADIDTHWWDLRTGQERWRMPVQSFGDAEVIFAPDGRTFAIASQEERLEWWDVEQRRLLFSKPLGYVRRMRASPDSKYFATVSADDEARVWEFSTGRVVRRIPYAGDAFGLAMSPDGKRLASSGDDTDATTAMEVTTFAPDDLVDLACARVNRNMTADEWHEHFRDAPYRPTCPAIESQPEQEGGTR